MPSVELIVSADDFGVSPLWDAGMLEASRAGAVDAVSVMVGRGGEDRLEQLLQTGIEVGLHVELGWSWEDGQAGARERTHAARSIEAQLQRFERAAGRPPAFLDGHHHCHARPGIGVVAADVALERDLPLRSVTARHRRLLRCRGVATADLLIGRLVETELLPPRQLDAVAELPATVEWMVHPGHPDPDTGSSYDRGRAEDLRCLLSFSPPAGVRRATHGEALARPRRRTRHA